MNSEDAFDISKSLMSAYQNGLMTTEEYEKRSRAIFNLAVTHGKMEALSSMSANGGSDTRQLAEVLKEQSLATSAPWRIEMANFQASYKALFEEAKKVEIAVLQKEVCEKALTKDLTSTEALCLQYLLFFEGTAEEANRMLATILLRVPPASRTKFHNWGAIASHMDSGDLSIHGSNMALMTRPLFPPKTCRSSNDKILAAQSKVLSGGGVCSSKGSSVAAFYRKEEEEEPTMVGGGYYEPVYDGSGNQTAVVAMDTTDAKFGELQAAISALQSSLASIAPPSTHRRGGAKMAPHTKPFGTPQQGFKPRVWGGDSSAKVTPKN